MKRLELSLFAGPLARAPGDLLVVPLPSDERPLRADAGWVDWRLCGAISRQIVAGAVTGSAGEAVLLPNTGPLRAGRVLLVGMGPRARLAGRPLQQGFQIVAGKLLGLRNERALIALPGSIDLELDGDLVLRGCIQTLAATPGRAHLRLVLPQAERHVRALKAALAAVAEDADRRQVGLDVEWLEDLALRGSPGESTPLP